MFVCFGKTDVVSESSDKGCDAVALLLTSGQHVDRTELRRAWNRTGTALEPSSSRQRTINNLRASRQLAHLVEFILRRYPQVWVDRALQSLDDAVRVHVWAVLRFLLLFTIKYMKRQRTNREKWTFFPLASVRAANIRLTDKTSAPAFHNKGALVIYLV